jgi:hypothetical protein
MDMDTDINIVFDTDIFTASSSTSLLLNVSSSYMSNYIQFTSDGSSSDSRNSSAGITIRVGPEKRSAYWSQLQTVLQITISLTTVILVLVTLLMAYVVWHAKQTNKRDKRRNTLQVEEAEAVVEAQRRRHVSNYLHNGVGTEFFVISEASDELGMACAETLEETDSVFESEIVFTIPAENEHEV